jgi:hypothetical protein
MTLKIYMKSGNVITWRHVKSYEIKNQGDTIIGIMIESRRILSFQPLTKTIALDQIEAVTRRVF